MCEEQNCISIEKNQSDDVGKLFEALAKAQGQLKKAKENSKNPFFKSTYANLESVWDAARSALSQNNLSIVQAPKIGANGEWILKTILGHSSGQFICSEFPIIMNKRDIQGFGSAITYAKRYSLSAMVGVSPGNDDDDGNAAVKRDDNSFITAEQVKQIHSLLSGNEELLDQVVNGFGSLEKIPSKEFDRVIKKIKTIKDKK